MALPTAENTWIHTYTNHQIVSDSSQTLVAETLLYIKNSMKSLGWTVRGSSNGTVANTSDNWVDADDFEHQFPASAHSWIVMRNETLDLEVCFDCASTTWYYLDIWVSRSAYSLGSPSTTNKPTSANEWLVQDNFNVIANTSCVKTNIHVLATNESPAETTAVMIFYTNIDGFSFQSSYFIFAKPAETPAGWTTPAIVMTDDLQFFGPQSSAHYSTKVNNYMYVGTDQYNFYLTGECRNGGLLAAQHDGFPSDLDGESGKIISAIGIFSDDTGARGSNGRLADVYWAPQHDPTGAIYSATSREWVKFGDLLFPWDGTNIPIVV